jgi:isochorismate hydrolase
LHDESPFSRIIPEFAAKPGFKVMRKTQYDAFYGTDLEKKLNEMGVRQIVIAGVMTSLCCETTARSAFVRGFDVFFLADGTATKSEVLHISALCTLAQGFAQVVSCREIISKLQ